MRLRRRAGQAASGTSCAITGLGALVLAALPAAAGTLVVANKSEATASLVDLPAGEVRATVATGDGPHEVAVAPDGRWAVVSNYGREEPGSTLTVIDVPAAEVARTIDLGDYRRPHGLAWLADGRRLLVTAESAKALLEVDVAAGEVRRAIATGQEVSHMVAVTPDGTRAFVANIGSGTVTAIDLARGEKLADVATGEGAEGIAVAPDGRRVWVTNRAADTVTAIDAASLAVVASIEVGSFPIRAEVTPDGRHLLVSNARSGTVAVIEAASARVAARIDLGELRARDTEGRLFGDRFGAGSPVPIGIEILPGGNRAYVANANADVITVLDLTTWTVVGGLTAGREPDGMAYSPLTVAVRENAPEG